MYSYSLHLYSMYYVMYVVLVLSNIMSYTLKVVKTDFGQKRQFWHFWPKFVSLFRDLVTLFMTSADDTRRARLGSTSSSSCTVVCVV